MILRFVIAFVFVVLVCGGIVGFNMFRDQAIQQYFANMPVAPVTVSAIEVAPITWTPGIQAIGTVGASRGVDLSVETTGIVKEIQFQANQRVEKGDLLVQLDNTQQRADLAAQRAQAALDVQNLTRAQALQKRGVGSDTTVEQAQASASASAAQVEKLEAVVEQKRLVAPFAGTLGIPRIDVGQYLAPGTTVATLQNLDVLRADFSIPEQSLELVQIGQPVRFGVTDDQMPFTGKIVGIEPKVDAATRLVLIRAEISNPDGKLAPGQFVQVRVQLPEEKDVVAVPQTTVVTSLYGDYVYVVRPAEGDGAAEGLVVRQIFVKTGRRSDGRIEVVEGLSKGDIVVTAGQNRLNNGSPVVIDNTVQPQTVAAREAVSQ